MESEDHVAAQSRRYEAAESMQLLNGLVSPTNQSDGNVPPQQFNQLTAMPNIPYQNLPLPIQHTHPEQTRAYDPLLEHRFRSPHNSKPKNAQQIHQSFAAQPPAHAVGTSKDDQRHFASGALRSQGGPAMQNPPANPTTTINHVGSQTLSSRETASSQIPKSTTGKKSSKKSSVITDEDEKPPAWSELKTKAGKDRKRLPLACIACRRKKIRCSGEKPACKHCLRSRIPCVYKVTTKKAAPRTDYMAMLDKRLKRMEERVIKIIPEDETSNVSITERAHVRPVPLGQAAFSPNSRKRAADEAFGPDLEGWAATRLSKKSMQGQKDIQNQTLTEGSERLPAREIQEHLAEVFFECLYGQSYLLLHKPNFMQRLKYVAQ
ncbi:MAG: hypothetical protein Q9218_001061 [Villophora microphyllina]